MQCDCSQFKRKVFLFLSLHFCVPDSKNHFTGCMLWYAPLEHWSPCGSVDSVDSVELSFFLPVFCVGISKLLLQKDRRELLRIILRSRYRNRWQLEFHGYETSRRNPPLVPFPLKSSILHRHDPIVNFSTNWGVFFNYFGFRSLGLEIGPVTRFNLLDADGVTQPHSHFQKVAMLMTSLASLSI